MSKIKTKLYIFLLLLWIFKNIHVTHCTVGGNKIKNSQLAKYIVSLREYNEREILYFGTEIFCTGSIITSKYIITAAHCIYGKLPRQVVIVAGTNYRLEENYYTQVQMAKRFIFHDSYDDLTLLNDIALVKMKSSLIIDSYYVDKVALAKLPPPKNCKLITLGWGATYLYGPQPADVMWAYLNILPMDSDCAQQFGLYFPRTFCAGNQSDEFVEPCCGDTGGPLFCHETLVGIVSFAIPHLAEGTNCINISFYVNWIETQAHMTSK